jgi:hypothetical protein
VKYPDVAILDCCCVRAVLQAILGINRFEPNRTFVDDLDQRERSRQPAPQTLQELQQALEQECGRIPQDCIRLLIESMPRRVRAVLQANCGHNRY